METELGLCKKRTEPKDFHIRQDVDTKVQPNVCTKTETISTTWLNKLEKQERKLQCKYLEP